MSIEEKIKKLKLKWENVGYYKDDELEIIICYNKNKK